MCPASSLLQYTFTLNCCERPSQKAYLEVKWFLHSFCCCGKNMRTIEDRFVYRLFYKIYGVVRCEYEISCDRCSLAIYQTIMLALFLRTELTKCRQEKSLKHENTKCVCAEDAYSCTLHTRLHVHSRRIVQIFVHLIQCTLCILFTVYYLAHTL